MTPIDIVEEGIAALGEYSRVPIAFEVRRVVDVERLGPATHRLAERELVAPYTKDYDALAGGPPSELPKRFDMRRWAVLAARSLGRRVGGAILAFDTPNVDMLEGRSDLAVVWDLRVAPAHRRRGVATALWRASEAWARARGCRRLKVETQDVNVPACRFYAKQGCALGAIRPGAYPDCPRETQLLWYKDLGATSPTG